MEPFKNIYNQSFFTRFIDGFRHVYPAFNKLVFLAAIYDSEWESRELKQRMRHISHTLHAQLTNNYATNVELILASIPYMKAQGFKANNLEFIIYPDYLEVYGMEAYSVSISAMETITQFASCEFAIRPFIIKYERDMLPQLYRWTKHTSQDVRRLASEGSRPRLPWAMAIESVKKDPVGVLPILEALKNDSSEYVRRSVANNLNDISKDHPQKVIEIAQEWLGNSVSTDKLIKHACRTLLKQGNLQVMPLFGFGSVTMLKIHRFEVNTPTVKIGETLTFGFDFENTGIANELVRLEYGVYYQKANGTLSKKVYKISEKTYAAGTKSSVTRKQSFRVITTRKFHIGLHQVSLIINGVELRKCDFTLVK
jgi:3-methyladenine DNA glycosylase AlkC